MVYYLERHIKLDSKQHGPVAMSILKIMIGNDRNHYTRVLHGAR